MKVVMVSVAMEEPHRGRTVSYTHLDVYKRQVGTLPNHIAVLGEYHISFHVCKKLSVSILMLFFNLGNAFE